MSTLQDLLEQRKTLKGEQLVCNYELSQQEAALQQVKQQYDNLTSNANEEYEKWFAKRQENEDAMLSLEEDNDEEKMQEETTIELSTREMESAKYASYGDDISQFTFVDTMDGPFHHDTVQQMHHDQVLTRRTRLQALHQTQIRLAKLHRLIAMQQDQVEQLQLHAPVQAEHDAVQQMLDAEIAQVQATRKQAEQYMKQSHDQVLACNAERHDLQSEIVTLQEKQGQTVQRMEREFVLLAKSLVK